MTTPVCPVAGCGGAIAPDGYCDTCGTKAAAAPSPAAAGATSGASQGAGVPAPPSPTGRCAEPGCGGTIAADGYCDTCGMAGAVGGNAAPRSAAAGGAAIPAPPTLAPPTAPDTASRAGRTGAVSRRTASARTGSTRSRLGAGLVAVPPTPVGDPASALMRAEKIASVLGEVPEEERFCSACGRAVGRASAGGPGRVTGFCGNCRTPFDFVTNEPSLQPGDLVGGQYEILGPLAHGGMGWIYLGRDKAVSDRWVVLKGLLNQQDPDAVAAAVAEKQYLAQLEHPNIVNIYNFVSHGGAGYIVMEYVGGESLNSKLKDRRASGNGPLPLPEALAYLLGILPAFEYLHDRGLVYNDLKPANVMIVGDDVKLIDLGAVMRADDPDAAIFGTAGFQAPEVAEAGPSVASDVFTVGRTLAVATLDFVFHRGDYEHRIPPPIEHGVLAAHESYHRLLLRATAAHPDDRFADIGELSEQLRGVLQEVVAVESTGPRPTVSRLFGGDRLTSLIVDPLADVSVNRPDWRVLPLPRADPDDPAAAFLADLPEAPPDQLLALLEAGVADGQVERTVEVRLHEVALALALGRPVVPMLEPIEADHPWDWRPPWFRAVERVRDERPELAADLFSRVWTELPGELAPKLGLALAAEQLGDHARAASLYQRVVGVDSTYVSAAFGLARCRAATGDTPGAIAAYGAVPPSSATYVDAQLATARSLAAGEPPSARDLAAAAATIERLSLDGVERAQLAAEIFERALAAGIDEPGTVVLGRPLDALGIRKGLEATYRELGRLAPTDTERVDWIDRANQVRPVTLW